LLLLRPAPGPGIERTGRGVVGFPMMRPKEYFKRDAPFVAGLILLLPTPAV
jgi:hypothetical protein